MGVFSSDFSLTGLLLEFIAFTLLLRPSDLAAEGSFWVMNMLQNTRELNLALSDS